MKKVIAVSLLLVASTVAAQTVVKIKNVYKLTHLSPSEAIVTCLNGAEPTFKKLATSTVMLSCSAQ